MKPILIALLAFAMTACVPFRALSPVEKVAYAPVAAVETVAVTPVVVLVWVGAGLPLWVSAGCDADTLRLVSEVFLIYPLIWTPFTIPRYSP